MLGTARESFVTLRPITTMRGRDPLKRKDIWSDDQEKRA